MPSRAPYGVKSPPPYKHPRYPMSRPDVGTHLGARHACIWLAWHSYSMCAGLAHDLLRACGPVSHDGLSASPAVALGVEVWSKVVGGMLGGILEEVAVALVSAPPPPARCALFCFALLNRNSCRALHHCALRFLPLYCLVSPLHCIASYLRHRTMYCLLSPSPETHKAHTRHA